MEHKITFSLGDPWGDGHGWFEEFHIKANYSAKEINKAYFDFCNKHDFNYVQEICAEYECGECNQAQTQRLLSLGLINEEDIYHFDSTVFYANERVMQWDKERDGCFDMESLDDYIKIFFKIISKELPDFKWEYNCLNEEILDCLNGAAYGMLNRY